MIINDIKRWWRIRKMYPSDLVDQNRNLAKALRKYVAWVAPDEETVPMGFSFEAAKLLESSANRIEHLNQYIKRMDDDNEIQSGV